MPLDSWDILRPVTQKGERVRTFISLLLYLWWARLLKRCTKAHSHTQRVPFTVNILRHCNPANQTQTLQYIPGLMAVKMRVVLRRIFFFLKRRTVELLKNKITKTRISPSAALNKPAHTFIQNIQKCADKEYASSYPLCGGLFLFPNPLKDPVC